MADPLPSSHLQEQTPPLTRKRKAAWASGAFADVFMANAFSYLAFPIYNVALKVDPAFLGWAMGVPRIWDALADVFVGNLSDNTRSRWGRRRPFIFFGALFSGLFFALMWMPPASSGVSMIGWYFLGMSILYYAAYAIFTVPWVALGLELSGDYHGRTNVQAWKNFFQAFGGIFLGALWWLSLRLGANEVEGVRWVGLIFGVLIAICGILPALLVKESSIASSGRERIPFFRALASTFRNRAFLCVIGFTVCTIFGVFVVNAFALYINIVYVFQGDKGAVSGLNFAMNAVFQVVGLAITPAVATVANRMGKRPTLITGLVLVIVGFGASWWTYTPHAPYLQGLTLALISPGLACLWIIGPSMIADICDVDELETGLRREGMFSAAFTWSIKLSIAVTMILSGYMLKIAGYDATREAGQLPGVVDHLRLLYMAVPSAMAALGILFVWLYPLTERRVREVQDMIATRKAQLLDNTDPPTLITLS
jgi:GPH family glycoside/pentoside/hexuronide:cation symporter